MTESDFAEFAARRAHLERSHPTTPEDLWDAFTNGDRLARWLGARSPDPRRRAPVGSSTGG